MSDAQYWSSNIDYQMNAVKELSDTKRISDMTSEEIKDEVKKAYSKVAQRTGAECCDQANAPTKESTSSCCDPSPIDMKQVVLSFGYSVDGLPASTIESYAGCGNPIALASLREGEVVLDLGSGAGLDVFEAAKRVGVSGLVIGVDMTPEMLQKAEKNAIKLGMKNVEFRKGDIESLPIEDGSIDIIISNCVINLAPDKSKVFREAFRVLRPGGRVMISDIVLHGSLPEDVRDEVITYTGCLGGAIPEEEYLQLMRDAGFEKVKVVEKAKFDFGSSARISGYKPKE